MSCPLHRGVFWLHVRGRGSLILHRASTGLLTSLSQWSGGWPHVTSPQGAFLVNSVTMPKVIVPGEYGLERALNLTFSVKVPPLVSVCWRSVGRFRKRRVPKMLWMCLMCRAHIASLCRVNSHLCQCLFVFLIDSTDSFNGRFTGVKMQIISLWHTYQLIYKEIIQPNNNKYIGSELFPCDSCLKLQIFVYNLIPVIIR